MSHGSRFCSTRDRAAYATCHFPPKLSPKMNEKLTEMQFTAPAPKMPNTTETEHVASNHLQKDRKTEKKTEKRQKKTYGVAMPAHISPSFFQEKLAPNQG